MEGQLPILNSQWDFFLFLSFFFPPGAHTETSIPSVSLCWWVNSVSNSSFQGSPVKFSAFHGVLSSHSSPLLGLGLNPQPSLVIKIQTPGFPTLLPRGYLGTKTCLPLSFLFLFGLWTYPVLSLSSTKLVKWCLLYFIQHFYIFYTGKVFRLSGWINGSWSLKIWVRVPALLIDSLALYEWFHLSEFQFSSLWRERDTVSS